MTECSFAGKKVLWLLLTPIVTTMVVAVFGLIVTSKLSLSELRRSNMTQLVLGSKEIEDMKVRSERVVDILSDGYNILDRFDGAEGELSDYGVVDEYRNETTIPAYERSHHDHRTKRFEVEMERGRKEGESRNVTRVDVIRDGEVEERVFLG